MERPLTEVHLPIEAQHDETEEEVIGKADDSTDFQMVRDLVQLCCCTFWRLVE